MFLFLLGFYELCPSLCSRANVFFPSFFLRLHVLQTLLHPPLTSSSAFVSLAPLEKLPPPIGVTLQKVTQQQLPSTTNQ